MSISRYGIKLDGSERERVMQLGLAGQTVLVTGSARGIGKGIAEGFLKEQARVIVTGRDEESFKATTNDFVDKYGKDNLLSFIGDLRQEKVLAELGEFIDKEGWGLNHLVCNIGSGKSVPPLQEDVEEFQRMLDVNLVTAMATVRILLPLLEKNAQKNNSSTTITFIGSICGVSALGCPVGYAAAKAGLESYAKNIARPLGKRGIRVNIVSPGNILFPGSTWYDKLSKDKMAVEIMIKRKVPLGTFGTPEDVANTVVFLASNCAKFVAGANWIVDGGQTK